MQKTCASLLTSLLALTLLVTGCSSGGFPGVYRLDIQQGNKVTRQMLDQLKTGMTPIQVSYVMGAPLMPDSFAKDRWDYVYTFQPGGEQLEISKVTLIFKDNKLSKIITGDEADQEVKPQQKKPATPKNPVS